MVEPRHRSPASVIAGTPQPGKFMKGRTAHGQAMGEISIWRCAGSATLRIVSQMEGKTDHTRISGRHILLEWEQLGICSVHETFMDRKNGWYDTKNDTIILSAEVTADEPTGVE
uniref:Uncharacterized protein n=1 Tax=Globodera rostochiensis TaxID=31243 RepID=A0A914IAC3_GLORO